jgi:membrane protease subunit HflK
MTVKQAKRYLRISTVAVVLFVALLFSFNSFYIIQEQEQAVVTTLGQPSVVETPGPHFKIPFIQEVTTVPMVISGFSIGYSEDGGSVNPSESLMITSDYNFVNVDFFLEYQVSDPERYLFASDDPVMILRNMALSYIRDTIGMHTVDEVITTGKNQIQSEIKEKMLRRLEEDNIGLTLVNITIQDAEPPTVEVIDAFKNVETAKQGADTAINTAQKYKSEQEPAARAQEDAILKNADAQREGRINGAKGQVAVFSAMYEEYRKNPLMTKQRIFYEAMEEVLPGMKIIIESGDGETTKLLPLDDFNGVGQAAPTEPANPATEVE